MKRNNPGNNKFLKQFNQTSILDCIRTRRVVSKAELSQLTGLSPTAIGIITSGLMDMGYIYETGVGESSGGRRPSMLELKPQSYYSVGIDLDVHFIMIMLMDMTGEIITEKAMDMPQNTTFSEVVKIIDAELACIMRDMESAKLIGIGVSVPGIIDSATRRIVFAPNLNWRDIDVSAQFSHYNVPVYVENEAAASAVCESWMGSCQGVDNFISINVKSGIGAGIFTQGMLFKGARGRAGEIGHIVVNESGPLCGCGNTGCLETMASIQRIVERAQLLVKNGTDTLLKNIEDPGSITIDDIVAAARKGDLAAMELLRESAKYIGIGIAYLINILNPRKVVIGKEFTKYSDLVLDYIRQVVHKKALESCVDGVEILASTFREKSSTAGAAILPLKVLFGR